MIELSYRAAQQIMLSSLGLAQPPRQKATKAELLSHIRQMHLLQLDTISVVARSHYLVLWSRLGDYDINWLEELFNERHLFEYWSHAACILPMEDYKLYRREMLDRVRSHQWISEHQQEVDKLLAHIQLKGPVRSADFERPDKQKGAGWWDWKPEKVTLEVLFRAGILSIAKRQGFQRFYDLHERFVPDWDDRNALSQAEARLEFTRKAAKALGVAQADWICDYFYRYNKKATQTLLNELVAKGEIVPVSVEGWPQPGYVHSCNLALVEAACKGEIETTVTTLLSPFDPLLSDRQRTLTAFGFDYRIECYTPAAKRRYGYFTLPILHKGQLIGRVDAKAHRKEKLFEVKKLHLEPQVAVNEELALALVQTFERCAEWHKTPQLVIQWTSAPELTALLGQMRYIPS